MDVSGVAFQLAVASAFAGTGRSRSVVFSVTIGIVMGFHFRSQRHHGRQRNSLLSFLGRTGDTLVCIGRRIELVGGA